MNDRITPSSANILYLVCIVLVAVLGSVSQNISNTWGLIFTEVALILLPALIALRLGRIHPANALRLKFPSPAISIACFLLGVGAWLLDGFIEIVINQVIYLLFKASPLPISLFPQNIGEGILFAVGFVLFAPICEEILFRGVIQRAYQPYGAVFSIVIPAGLFILFHMRLLGLVPLIPIALAISYVFHRTRSLGAAMLVHAGNNLMVGVQMILFSIAPSMVLPLPSAWGALAGTLLFAINLFWLISRGKPRPLQEGLQPTSSTPEPTDGQRIPALRLRSFLALLPALLIYLVMAGGEFISVFYPGVLAMGKTPLFAEPAWQQPINMNYTLYNKNDDMVGNASCIMAQDNELIQLHCRTQIEGFEFRKGQSYYSAADSDQSLEVSWDKSANQLLAFEKNDTGENYQYSLELIEEKGGLLLRAMNSEVIELETPYPKNAALIEELPFRFMMTDFSAGNIYKISVFYPSYYNTQTQQSEPNLISELVIIGQELAQLENGEYELAWKVRLGKDITLWYEIEPPNRLLRMENNMFTYRLNEFNQSPADQTGCKANQEYPQ